MKLEIPVATCRNPIPTGKNFHCTRKGPGRIHNNSTTEHRLARMEPGAQYRERNRVGRWPTKVAKFYVRFGFCPVTVPIFVP
jgi:hypothetical protein